MKKNTKYDIIISHSILWPKNAYQYVHSQTVENQHKANKQIVHEEIIAISQKSTGQTLEISKRFEIVEIEEFRPWSQILSNKCPNFIEPWNIRCQSVK